MLDGFSNDASVLDKDADAFAFPDPLDLSFEGFQPEAFAILERLRRHPHIDQYREEKGGIQRYLKDPFKRYRDDLVVNWVLPNRLDFETERNVFSRLLKNDFGAGGCHHHLWMAFYRPGRRRLTDVQLSHSITPDGFEVGMFVGGYMRALLKQAKANMAAAPDRLLELLYPLLEGAYSLDFRYGSGDERMRRVFDAPIGSLPDDLCRADAIWVRRRFSRADVLAWEGELVRHAVGAVCDLWPLYRFILSPGAN